MDMVSSIIGFALDCSDADGLADFYARLLGWEKTLSGGGWAGIAPQQPEEARNDAAPSEKAVATAQ